MTILYKFIVLLAICVGLGVTEIPSKCLLPKVTGNKCRAAIGRYHFSATTNKCLPFIYGGCGANENNFVTREECAMECENKVSETTQAESTTTTTTVSPDTCSLPPQKGMCRAYFPRFYFDKTADACKGFVYGGCQGNANNFKTEEECVQRCLAEDEISEQEDDEVEGAGEGQTEDTANEVEEDDREDSDWDW